MISIYKYGKKIDLEDVKTVNGKKTIVLDNLIVDKMSVIKMLKGTAYEVKVVNNNVVVEFHENQESYEVVFKDMKDLLTQGDGSTLIQIVEQDVNNNDIAVAQNIKSFSTLKKPTVVTKFSTHEDVSTTALDSTENYSHPLNAVEQSVSESENPQETTTVQTVIEQNVANLQEDTSIQATQETQEIADDTTKETTTQNLAPLTPSVVIDDDNQTLSGVAQPNTFITIKDEDGNIIGTTKTDSSGHYTVTLSTPLENGEKVHISATDSAGNVSADNTDTAHNLPTTNISLANDTYKSGDNITNDGKLNIASNETITKVVANGVELTPNANGEYILPDGSYPQGSIVITTQNAQGKLTQTTLNKPVNVDTVAPDKPSTPSGYADNVGNNTSTNSTSNVTDDTTPSINIGKNLTDTPKLYVNGHEVESVYDKTTGTLTPKTPLIDGSYEITYTLTDSAGNESAKSAAMTLSIDNTAPNRPNKIADFKDDMGNTKNDNSKEISTDDTTPSFNIGKNLTDTPKLYINGVEIAASYDKTNGTLTPISQLGEGTYSISYTLTDSVGNESAKSEALNLNIDTTAPNNLNKLTTYVDNTGAITSDQNSSNTTDDTLPGFNIGKNLTDTPKLYVDGAEVTSTYNSTTGTLTPTTPLSSGDHTITYTLTDQAGNESDKSEMMSLNIDTTAPDTPSKPTSYIDNRGKITSDNSQETSTDDTTPSIHVGKNLTDTPKLYVDGKFVESTYDKTTGTLTPNVSLADGTHTLAYTLTDKAGNESNKSEAMSLTFEADAPRVSIEATTDVAYEERSDSKLTYKVSLQEAPIKDVVIKISLSGKASADDFESVHVSNGTYDSTTNTITLTINKDTTEATFEIDPKNDIPTDSKSYGSEGNESVIATIQSSSEYVIVDESANGVIVDSSPVALAHLLGDLTPEKGPLLSAKGEGDNNQEATENAYLTSDGDDKINIGYYMDGSKGTGLGNISDFPLTANGAVLDTAGGDDIVNIRGSADAKAHVILGDGDDTLSISGVTSTSAELLGGAGNDKLYLTGDSFNMNVIGGFEDIYLEKRDENGNPVDEGTVLDISYADLLQKGTESDVTIHGDGKDKVNFGATWGWEDLSDNGGTWEKNTTVAQKDGYDAWVYDKSGVDIHEHIVYVQKDIVVI